MSALCSAKAVGEKRLCTRDVFLPASPAGLCVGPRVGDGRGSRSLVLAWSRLSSPTGVLRGAGSAPHSGARWTPPHAGHGHCGLDVLHGRRPPAVAVFAKSLPHAGGCCHWGGPGQTHTSKVGQVWSVIPGQAQPVFSEDWLTSGASLLGRRLCRNHQEQ